MAYPLNSEEFAHAWRIVSESLLAALQTSDISSILPSGKEGFQTTDTIKPKEEIVTMQKEQIPLRTIESTVYANCPISDGKGGYLFKNLKEEKSEQSTFKVVRYTDDTVEFSIVEDLSTEARQQLKDNLSNRLPTPVGSVEGVIKEGCKIINEMKGNGIKEGLRVRIVSPLKVIFK